MRPTSRSGAASSFWRGYAASLRRSWLGPWSRRPWWRHPQDVRPVPVDQLRARSQATLPDSRERSDREGHGSPFSVAISTTWEGDAMRVDITRRFEIGDELVYDRHLSG